MYMVTGSIVHKHLILREDKYKEFFLNVLFEKANLFGWTMEAWAVLNNHYHFIAQSPENANSLSKFLQQVHSITAIQFNRWDNISGRQVWHNYWDTCTTYEKSYLGSVCKILLACHSEEQSDEESRILLENSLKTRLFAPLRVT